MADLLIAAVVGGVACAFGLLLVGGTGGLALAIALPAIVAYGFYRAARVAVVTRPEGVRVFNSKRSYEVPWADVARFAFVDETPRGPPEAYLERTDGRRLPVEVLRGPNLTTESHRRWAAEAMEELNRRVERHRVT
jgi:hypothetical protein